MATATYLVHFERTKNGDVIATVPALPGCQVKASGYDEALEAAKVSIEEYLRTLAQAGKKIPVQSAMALPFCIQVKVDGPTFKPGTRGK